MLSSNLFLLPLASILITLLSLPFIRSFALKVGAIDHPNHRKQHGKSVPTSGGLAIFLAFISVLVISGGVSVYLGFLIGATMVTAIGFFDDVYDSHPFLKLLVQSVAAYIVINSGIKVSFITDFSGEGVLLLGDMVASVVTFLWIIGITNAINLLDGLDGLAAGVVGISSAALGFIALMLGRVDVAILAFSLAAASFAFLPSNFSGKKKIFMGDSGSNFLGFSLAVIAILGSVKVAAAFSMMVPFVVLAVPILDVFVVMLKRILRRKPVMGADREHLHHKLTDIVGLSEKEAVIVIYTMTLILSGIAILSVGFSTKTAVVVYGGILALLSFIILAVVSKHQGRKNGHKH